MRLSYLVKCVLFLIYFLLFSVFVSCYDGFESYPASFEKEKQFLEYRQFSLHFPNEESLKFDSGIETFDVSLSQKIALGLDSGIVLVLDSQGEILWWLSFKKDGACYVEWQGNNLLLMFSRGSSLVEFTDQGEYVQASCLEKNSRTNNTTRLDIANRYSVVIENETFSIKKGIAIWSADHAKLIKIDTEGNTLILYNAENAILLRAVGWLSIGVLGALVVCHQIKKRKKLNNTD